MLYIVGTPIGNIEDTSLRAVKTLAQSDIILVEDTATFDSYYSRIQTLFNISSKKEQKIVHYHKENEFEKMPWVVDLLKQEKIISLVSESGLPTISDPGSVLVKYLIKTNIPFTVIPGPTAFTTAAIFSGFPTDQILFLGFLPKKDSQIIRLFTSLKNLTLKEIKPTIVFYESPYRINKTLEIISQIIPDAEIAIAREMTKKFEEIIRGKAQELKVLKFKGELTVVLKLIIVNNPEV